MNKCLLRKLKPFLLKVAPQDVRHLIAAFDLLTAAAKRSQMQFTLLVRAFRLITQDGLRKKDSPENQLFQEISKFEIITDVWLEELARLWTTFFSPAILLLLFLETTLDSNLVPERSGGDKRP